MNNKNRIKKVKRLLGLFKGDRAVDDETHYYRIADVLCDLQHYCDKYAIDFSQEIRMADVYYKDEISQEEKA